MAFLHITVFFCGNANYIVLLLPRLEVDDAIARFA